MVDRRNFVLGSLGAAWAATGCQPADPHAHMAGGFTGVQPEQIGRAHV